MTSQVDSKRPTVRPVTLGRLVETTHLCSGDPRTTEDLETALDVTHRRARETILESQRLDLIEDQDLPEDESYRTTSTGHQFLRSVRDEEWTDVSDLLEDQSPHYRAFLETLEEIAPASLEEVLTSLEEREASTDRSYNQTSVEVVGDWAERLNVVQRNAFTGDYYVVENELRGIPDPERFPENLLAVFDELEETAGVDLRQRYLSVPELRESFCERHACTRSSFDDALRDLSQQNVGQIELSGAPLDTGAKDARLGIKEIEIGGDDSLVTTDQSTDRVMAGIEQYDKQYYYVAVHDRDLTFETTRSTESPEDQ